MTPFRQLILPGEVGSDVFAVKRAAVRMGANGAGAMILTGPARKRSGATFVSVVKGIQRRHGILVDGKYGKLTHDIVAPHFDLWGVSLYRSAAIRERTPPPPEPWHETARQAAVALVALQKAGKYRADNPGDFRDIAATAAGKPVWSALGRWVWLDPRPLELVQWLIVKKGYRIGTFALCSDHHDDGPHGHAGGLAVDISSINGRAIGGGGAHDLTLAVAKLVRQQAPRQLICAGAGGAYYSDIESCCIPDANYYDGDLAGHRNHIHAGY